MYPLSNKEVKKTHQSKQAFTLKSKNPRKFHPKNRYPEESQNLNLLADNQTPHILL